MADLNVSLAEFIATGEQSPGEPPSAPKPQVLLPSGYRQSSNYLTDDLSYSGPWPSGDFTVCYWAWRHGRWYLGTAAPVYSSTMSVDGEWTAPPHAEPQLSSLLLAADDADPVEVLSPFPATAWHHVAVVRSGGYVLLSLDGRPFVLLGVAARTVPWAEEVLSPRYYYGYNLGWASTPQWAYYRMWDVALGLTELRLEARARQAVRTANLWRDTPLEGSVNDVSGNGRNWTIVGTAVAQYGGGPLPWAADAVEVQDAVGATLQAQGERRPVELLGARDVLRVQGELRAACSEAVTCTDLVAAAPPNLTQNRVVRWYVPDGTDSPPGYTPPTKRGGWTVNASASTIAKLKPTTALNTFSPTVSLPGWSGAGAAGSRTFLMRHVSDGLPAQVVQGRFNIGLYARDEKGPSNAADASLGQARWAIYIYVTQGDTDNVRGVLLDYATSNSKPWRWVGGRFHALDASVTLTPVVLQTGDRIVIEWGFYHPTGYSSSGASIYVAAGAGTRMNDGVPNTTTTYLANGWVEFESGVLTTLLGSRNYDSVLGAELRSPNLPQLAARPTDAISLTEPEPLVQDPDNLYVAVADTVGVTEVCVRPIGPTARVETRTVTEYLTRRLLPGIGRWYLSAATVPFTPASWKGAWTITQLRSFGGSFTDCLTRLLSPVKQNGGSQISFGSSYEVSASEVDYPLGRWVSPPLAAQTISGTLQLGVHLYESGAGMNAHTHVHVWVTQGDTDSVRGTLLNDFMEAAGVNEWPESDTGVSLSAVQSIGPLAIQAGDRIVVELGFRARNTVTTAYGGTLRAGTLSGTTEMPDLVLGGSASTATWLDFIGSQVQLLAATDLSPAEAKTVSEFVQVSLAVKAAQVNEPVTVADAVTPLLPVWAGKSASEAATVADSITGAIEDAYVPPLPSGDLTSFVSETIAVAEWRVRGVDTSKLEVEVHETLTVTEIRQRASYPVVWDGSGAPPAPATIADDYWLVGV